MEVTYCKQRFYNADPNEITLDQCANHGASHKAYSWNPQIDPRWNDEKKQAYLDAYEKEEKNA